MTSRRQFLRGDFSGKKQVLRPPWAVAEAEFLRICTGCGACITACPEKILVEVRRYPEVRFENGECTFCGACLSACLPRALDKVDGQAPWRLNARIAESCLSYQNVVCRSCSDACGEAAIRFSPRLNGAAMPDVLADRCTGCGACVSTCPVGAVTMAAADGTR